MTDVLPVRLAKLALAEIEDGFDVDWNDLSEEDQERLQRAAMRVYQEGVQDALKESP